MSEISAFYKALIQGFPNYGLKSTSVKKGCAKSKKTPKFGAGAIFKNCQKILKAKKLLVLHCATVDYINKSILQKFIISLIFGLRLTI